MKHWRLELYHTSTGDPHWREVSNRMFSLSIALQVMADTVGARVCPDRVRIRHVVTGETIPGAIL